MKKEIEAKFKVTSAASIEKKIEELGAEFVKKKTTNDIYFKVPEEKPYTRYLRIRIEGGEGELAYHEVVNNDETLEWELTVNNIKIMSEILNKLGFLQDVAVKKTRKKYQLGSAEILVDNVEKLGNFVEVEVKSQPEMVKLIRSLELSNKNRIKGLGYPDLIRAKLNERPAK